ncbi:MAG: hypothetical protein ACREJF_08935, partial [Candidatus Methylomirabilales bacterium]
MQRSCISIGAAVAAVALAACGTLPPSPVATEAFQKREQALHIALFWDCRPVEAGGLLIAGVVQVSDTAQPILGLRFAATAYDKDGRRLTHVVGFPDGLRIGYEGWTRFGVLVPGGQAAARVDLGYEYHLPPDSSDRPITQHRPLLFQLARTEEYFATILDACRS